MSEAIGEGGSVGREAQLRRSGLRSGWTTGACATAATTAAYTALLTGEFPDPVTITLPKGQHRRSRWPVKSWATAGRWLPSSRTRATIPT